MVTREETLAIRQPDIMWTNLSHLKSLILSSVLATGDFVGTGRYYTIRNLKYCLDEVGGVKIPQHIRDIDYQTKYPVTVRNDHVGRIVEIDLLRSDNNAIKAMVRFPKDNDTERSIFLEKEEGDKRVTLRLDYGASGLQKGTITERTFNPITSTVARYGHHIDFDRGGIYDDR